MAASGEKCLTCRNEVYHGVCFQCEGSKYIMICYNHGTGTITPYRLKR